MIAYERPIRFEDVDAARIVFFGRFFGYAHEAMEAFFGGLEGGYSGLILRRQVGFPAVHAEASFSAPARYGDTLRIETSVTRVGTRSAVLRYRMFLVSTGTLAADLSHTVVTSDLATLTSCDMPADVRALLLAHREPAPAAATP